MAKSIVIGAGWFKKSDHGDYISISFKPEEMGQVDLYNSWVNMAPNKNKSKPSHPDYLISVSPKQQSQVLPPQPPQAQINNFPKPNNSFPAQQNSNHQAQQTGGFTTPQGWDSEDPGF